MRLLGSSALLCCLCTCCFFKHGISFPFTSEHFCGCSVMLVVDVVPSPAVSYVNVTEESDGYVCTGVKDYAVM